MVTKSHEPQSRHSAEAPPVDEYAGQGGSYLLDPATGRRTLVARTDLPVPVAQPVVPVKE